MAHLQSDLREFIELLNSLKVEYLVVRAELEHRRRNRLLTEMLAELDAKHGPVDDSLVEKYVGLLT